MSTRGVVAVRREDGGWSGVYNNSDSYPTELGKEVWRHFRAALDNGRLHDACLELVQYDDWCNYLSGGVCPYCGKAGLGQPHSIRGDVYMAGVEGSSYPDPEAKGHSHGELGAKITSEENDPLFHEWVYVVDPFKQTIEVLASVREPGEHEEGPNRIGEMWMDPNYGFATVHTLTLYGVEPTWEYLERAGELIKEAARQRVEGVPA